MSLRGHLDAIILKLIIEEDMYGYEIAKEISSRTNEMFQIKEATLYAVFQRLEKKDLIEPYYGDKTQGGRRKYYRITLLGKAYYSEKIKEWQEIKKNRQHIHGGMIMKALEEDIVTNLSEKVEDLMEEGGKSEEDAINKAIVEFGDVAELKEGF